MKNIIEVNNVSFEYITDENTLKAIDNLDLQVKEGEFVAIIGHNGSGKSTLSKNLNAILFPTEGNILINKMDTREEDKLWDIRQTAGMVFQNPDNQIVARDHQRCFVYNPSMSRSFCYDVLPNGNLKETKQESKFQDLKNYVFSNIQAAEDIERHQQ